MNRICSKCQAAKKREQGKLPPRYSQDALAKHLLNTRRLSGCCPPKSCLQTGDLTRGFDQYPGWHWVRPREFDTSSPLTKRVYRCFLPCFNQSEKKALALWEYLQNKEKGTLCYTFRVIEDEWNHFLQETCIFGKHVSLKDPRSNCLYIKKITRSKWQGKNITGQVAKILN